MFTRLIRQLMLAAIAVATLLPAAGCGCRKNCCPSSSFAPPPAQCCDPNLPPAGFTPTP
jgi:hypothetical protein